MFSATRDCVQIPNPCGIISTSGKTELAERLSAEYRIPT